MIIELESYNKTRELLIEIGITGLHGHICYWDRGQRVSVTMVAVHMGVKEHGCKQGTGAHKIGLQVGNEGRYTYNCCGESKKC